jgi:hypothetical protein
MTPNAFIVAALAREHRGDLLREAEYRRLRGTARAGPAARLRGISPVRRRHR